MSQAQKGNWVLSSIIQRKRLNSLSDKETFHLVLDLKDTEIVYNVGDCIKILPQNPPLRVEKILRILGLSGDEIIQDRTGNEFSIEKYLLDKADLHKVTKKLFFAMVQSKEYDEPLLQAENKEKLKEFLEKADLLDELEKIRPTLSADQLVLLLQPLIPRYYSIASSMHAVKEEAHLTIAAVGIASDYLCKGVELNDKSIKIEHHRSPHFGLPEDSHQKPIIMIGPGTGIAPFRGFLQERVSLHASPDNWLFFGERSSTRDFYYQDYLVELQKRGCLKLDTAFSRDGAEKVYVQHRIYEKRHEFWEWIDKRGAYLFVCGDKDRMAKAVEETILRIISEEGGLSEDSARKYLQNLRQSKRYMRDVY